MNRRLILGFLALALAAVAARVVWDSLRSLDQPLAVVAPVRFKVAPGMRFAQVAAALARQGILRGPRAWALYARWTGRDTAIRAGEYAIDPGLTPRGLLEKMVDGQVILHSLTIVDGWRVADLLLAIRRNPDIATTLPENPNDLMAKLGSPGTAPEGEFLPETYRFPSGTTDVELLREAHAAMTKTLADVWGRRDAASPLTSPYELLIMASIIEKESGVPSELPTIAGLYLHRLAIGMRLQADPTVIYGLGDAYTGELQRVDLRTDGPYNSYTRTGLPPTPIALPGLAAIAATAHPARTEALYFVASGNGDGRHVFSTTLAEHHAAVVRYLAKLRQRAASESPR